MILTLKYFIQNLQIIVQNARCDTFSYFQKFIFIYFIDIFALILFIFYILFFSVRSFIKLLISWDFSIFSFSLHILPPFKVFFFYFILWYLYWNFLFFCLRIRLLYIVLYFFSNEFAIFNYIYNDVWNPIVWN